MPKAPTILQIIPELGTGGAERTVIEVAEAIVRAGGTALVASEGGRLADELAQMGGELIPFPAGSKNPLRMAANASRLEALIRARGIDLVHARSRAPAWSAYLAARRTKRPFVTTYHGIYNQKSPLKSWYNSVMARGDVVIANSHYTARLVRERHGTPESRLRVIYRGVDLQRFSPSAVSAARIASLKESWGVPADARVIVQAARLTRWKGQHVLIGAAGLLQHKPCFRGMVVVIAGDDQGRSAYREELATRIHSLGLAGRVVLTGHCADVPAAFAGAWLAVVPSIEPEAFGRASIEAQAMGCPVIASAIGALPETLRLDTRDEAKRSGWTVPAGDEAELARALESALQTPAQLHSAMAAAARNNAAAFSKTALQGSTLQVYDDLLGSRMAQTCEPGRNSAEAAGQNA